MGLSHSKNLMSIIRRMNQYLRKDAGLLFIAVLQILLPSKYFLEICYLHQVQALKAFQKYYHSGILTGFSVDIFGL